MAGPSEIVPLDDVSVVVPEHAEVRPLLPELDGVGDIRAINDEFDVSVGVDDVWAISDDGFDVGDDWKVPSHPRRRSRERRENTQGHAAADGRGCRKGRGGC